MTEIGKSILVVEDDASIANGLALNLKLQGFATQVAGDGDAALEAIAATRPSLILLDISLPKKNGLEVLGTIREAGDTTPVIVLSARQNEFDKVSALRLGADDYVTKPFGVAELLARIEAVLRRLDAKAPGSAEGRSGKLGFGDVRVDLDSREVHRGDALVPMTHLQFELLVFLLQHPDRVYTRDELLSKVWGLQHAGSARTVDNFVGQLRSKFEATPNRPRHFLTVRSKGYKFTDDSE